MILQDAFKGYLPKGPIWDYRVFPPLGLEDDFVITVSIKVEKGSPWIDYTLDLNTKKVVVRERQPKGVKKIEKK